MDNAEHTDDGTPTLGRLISTLLTKMVIPVTYEGSLPSMIPAMIGWQKAAPLCAA